MAEERPERYFVVTIEAVEETGRLHGYTKDDAEVQVRKFYANNRPGRPLVIRGRIVGGSVSYTLED